MVPLKKSINLIAYEFWIYRITSQFYLKSFHIIYKSLNSSLTKKKKTKEIIEFTYSCMNIRV